MFVNSDELEAIVSAELFSRRNFSATLVLSGAAGQDSVTRSALTQQTQVTFHRASTIGNYAGGNNLGGGDPSPSSAFRPIGQYGFHYKRIGTNPERIHIVVPEENGVHNFIVASDKVDQNSITYASSDETYVVVRTIRRLGQPTQLNLYGTGRPHADKEIYLRAKSSSGTILAEAKLWLMPLREYNVKLYFVADPTNPNGTMPELILSDVRDIQSRLNAIWKQANVRFNVTIDTDVKLVDYDKNGDGKLDYYDESEYMAIRNALSSNGNSAYIHVYYIKDINAAGREILGFALEGDTHVFISDRGRFRSITVLAHELGHVLRLPHNQEFQAGRDPNPFSFLEDDFDLHDQTSLMWWSNSFTNTHIGSPFWKRLNEVHCNREDWFVPCTLMFRPPY
jgi:hypothetical protein